MRKIVLLVLLLTLATAVNARAQDVTPPVFTYVSADTIPSDKKNQFFVVPSASDDVAVSAYEYRTKLDKFPFSKWSQISSLVTLVNFTITCSPRPCSLFVIQFRAIDSSGNTSPSVGRSFRSPFEGPAGEPFPDEIADPPIVNVEGTKATFVLKKFAAPKLGSSTRAARLRAATKKKSRGTVFYDVTAVNQVSQEIRRITSKRNVLTAKDLPTGDYSASYSARFVKGKNTLATTGTSPGASFTVN